MLCFGSVLPLSVMTQAAAGQVPGVEKVTALSGPVGIPVHAVGRTQMGADGMYTFQWPGTYFVFAYRGSAAFFTAGAGRQDLHITVDGHTSFLLTNGEAATYRITAPGDGIHEVRIDSVNESNVAPESVGNFAVAAGGKGVDTPVGQRQIEFIGDSHTVGYGNTSPSRQCTGDQLFATTDASQSLGADTARHFGADYQIQAISGHGIVRNYNGAPGDPVPVAYPYLLLDKAKRYENPDWHPQVIVISLGTNDFSTPLHPAERWKSREELHRDYEKTYVSFVQQLRRRNPKALVVLWSTDQSDGEIAAEVGKVVQQLQDAGDHNVDAVVVSGLAMSSCDFHPSAADDRLISHRLVEDIDKHPEVWGGAAADGAQSQADVVFAEAGNAAQRAAPEIALTWDDLPAHGVLLPGLSRLELTREILNAMQAEHLPPTYGFVNGIQFTWEPQSDAVLRAWVDSGNLLGNHTWSHMNPDEHTFEEYKADISKNEPLLAKYMGDKDWHWFRYPFLAEGKTPEKHKEIRDYLAKNGYRIAAVTMGFPDYDWDTPYLRCVTKGDTAATARIETAYLQAAHDAALYSRKLSMDLYGKDVPYVLLLHVGPLDAKLLPKTLAQYRAMGFIFTSLDRAESGPFYNADRDPSLSGASASLAARLYERGVPMATAPVYPKLDQVCR